MGSGCSRGHKVSDRDEQVRLWVLERQPFNGAGEVVRLAANRGNVAENKDILVYYWAGTKPAQTRGLDCLKMGTHSLLIVNKHKHTVSGVSLADPQEIATAPSPTIFSPIHSSLGHHSVTVTTAPGAPKGTFVASMWTLFSGVLRLDTHSALDFLTAEYMLGFVEQTLLFASIWSHSRWNVTQFVGHIQSMKGGTGLARPAVLTRRQIYQELADAPGGQEKAVAPDHRHQDEIEGGDDRHEPPLHQIERYERYERPFSPSRPNRVRLVLAPA